MAAESIFLQDREGAPIGPLPLRALEILYDSRVVDEDTPVSRDGVNYRAIRDAPGIHRHVQAVKARLVAGENPWANSAPEANSSPRGAGVAPPEDEAPAVAELVEVEPAPLAEPLPAAARPLAAMLQAAATKSTGHLTLSCPSGALTLYYKEGKITALATNMPDLALGTYLTLAGVTTEALIARAEERAEQLGGDLGAALIALGLIPPHTYVELFAAWARRTLCSVVTFDYEDAYFEKAETMPVPAIPLGFDRFGILMDVIRESVKLDLLEEGLLKKKGCVLIPSQVEGVALEDLKLKPRELRIFNAINGTKSLAELLDSLGGNEQKSLEILQVVYFGVETGLTVLGPDPTAAREAAEVARLREVFEVMKTKNHFEVLNIKESSTDEETRAHYADLVKQYHPDTLRQDCLPELLELRRELFRIVTTAFEAVQTAKHRADYAQALKEGRTNPDAEQEKVRAALRAETLFKKAEIFARTRKYKEAVENLIEAMALNAEDVEFKVHHAYYAFMAAGHSGEALTGEAERAARAIAALVKGKPPLLSASLFQAHLLKAAHKPEEAVKHYKKVIEIDGKHVEALREIRLYNSRQEKTKKKGLF